MFKCEKPCGNKCGYLTIECKEDTENIYCTHVCVKNESLNEAEFDEYIRCIGNRARELRHITPTKYIYDGNKYWNKIIYP